MQIKSAIFASTAIAIGAIGLSGCATKDFVRDQVAVVDTKVQANQTELAQQKSTLDEHQSHLAQLDQTAQDALNRATAAGKLAYEHSTAIFRAGERLEQALGESADETPLSLNVGTSGTVARATSADFLLPLFALEGCIPTIRIGETLELLRELHANELDLVLSETEPSESALQGLEHEVMDRIPLVAIIATNRQPREDWQDVGLVQYPTTSNFYWEVTEFLKAQNLRPRIVGEADDPFLLVEASARGGHVTIVPGAAARDAVTAGRVQVLKKLASAHAGVHALYQSGAAADLARRAIARLIAAAKSA